MKVCVSVDLDDYREYQSLVVEGGDQTERSFYDDAVPRFLDLFDRHGVRATFFVIGRDASAPAARRRLREIAARGHELGNHSYTHPYNFRGLPTEKKIEEIELAEDAVADAVGERPVGFRTPSCDVDAETLSLLAERGYLYDSSVLPSPLMWAFMLYGKLFVKRDQYQLGELAAAFAPANPYVPSLAGIHRPRTRVETGPVPVLEIPFSVLPLVRIPFYSTLLRRLGNRFFSRLVALHRRRQPVLHSLFHQIELAEFSETPLGRAYARMPGLDVTLEQRSRFLDHAMAELTGAGESVTMRELARSYVGEQGLEGAA